MDSGLTLEAAIKVIRQQQTLNGSSKVDAVGFQTQKPSSDTETVSELRPRNAAAAAENDTHGTRDEECYHCGGKGHYGAVPQKRPLSRVSVVTKTKTNRPSSRE